MKEWLQLIVPGAAVAGAGYVTYLAFFDPKRRAKGGCVNQCIKKNVDKVVDMVEIEDIAEKAVFCRCWKSKNVSLFNPLGQLYSASLLLTEA